MFGEGPECGPFAADKAEDDGAAAAGCRFVAAGHFLPAGHGGTTFDAVVAADEPRLRGVMLGEGPDAGEACRRSDPG